MAILYTSHAQIMFQRHYGGSGDDIAGDVQQTTDGGYIITGQTKSFGDINGDVYLIKTNEYGDTLWTKKYGGAQFDRGTAIRQTIDGGFIIAGSTESFGAGQLDAYLIRINSVGDTLWTKTFGGTLQDEAYDVIETSDGYALVGYSMSYATVFSSVYLIKTDLNGNLSWSKNYEKLEINDINEFKQTPDDGYFLAAMIRNQGSAQKSNIWLLKTDEFGDTTWTTEIANDTSSLIVSSVETTLDNGYVLAGSIEDPTGETDAMVIKTDNTGTQQWIKRYDRGEDERAACIRKTSDSNYIVSGIKDFSAKKLNSTFGISDQTMLKSDEKLVSSDILLMKINLNGDTLWTKTFGGSGNDWSRKVFQSIDNGFVILGFTYSFSADNEIYLIKTNTSGFASIHDFNEFSCFIYPNPCNGLVQIELSQSGYLPLQYSILDLNGKVLSTGTLNSACQSISIPFKGLYVLNFKNSKISFSKKIIVE